VALIGDDMASSSERAILAGGCFWGMQDLIRKMPGVISTRVGYSGGDVPNATYRNHGTHAEAIEIVFDPSIMSYRSLLEFFLSDPRSDHDQPSGQRPGHELSLRHLLCDARTEANCRRYHCRCRCIEALARQGRDGGCTGRSVLGGGAGTSGLSGALSGRLHLPFCAAKLEAPAADGSSEGQLSA
jgi:hypothetical protein